MSIQSVDLDFLLANVTELENIGTIGPVIVFGPDAFAVAVGKYSDATVPFIGASRLGDGRCVIAGHDGYFCPAADYPNARILFSNAIRWASGQGQDSKPSIATYAARGGLNEALTAAGFEFKALNDSELESITVDKYQVLIVGNTNKLEGGNKVEAVRAFIKSGGGCLAGNTAWASWTRDSIKESHPGNQLVWESGLGWTPVYSVSPAKGTNFSTDRDLYKDTNALVAWKAINEAFKSGVDLPKDREVQLRTIFTNAADNVSNDDEIFLRQVRTELGLNELPVPCAENPIMDNKVKPLIYCSDRFCQVNPACSDFPGGCNALPETDPVTVELTVGASDTWHSTGLYAPAGQLITVEVEDSLTTAYKFSLQIGTHRDNLYSQEKWSRFPVVVLKSSSKAGPKCTLTLTSTFGGLIYVCTESDGPRRPVTAHITGGARAPYFVLGTATLDEWKTIRERDVPWGELVGREMILTMPRDKLMALDDPETLLKQWDSVMDNYADFCGLDRNRSRAYRMCADVQLSGGWMHSGYPFMIYLSAVDLALDAAKLRTKEGWGYYHEIGHNHQKKAWTWSGLTEVTNNILCVHVLNTMFGLSWAEARPDAFEPAALRKVAQKFIDGGRKVSDLKADPFVYLTMYYQLQVKYGWEPYRRVFKFYEDLPDAQQPSSSDDQARIDLWVQTFSETVGENLAPFYKSWGLSVGGAVETKLSELPVADLSVDQLLQA